MSVSALLLLFISALLHALWNLLLKQAREKYIAMGWQVLLSGVFSFILLLFVGFPPRSMWIFAVISMVLETIYFSLLSRAYIDNDFSLVYPIARGTAPAFLMAWSVLFLREKLTTGGMAGVGLIVCGMILIGATSLLGRHKNKFQMKGVFLALMVALTISLYTLVDGSAVKNGSPISYGLMMFMMIPLLITPYNLRRHGWRDFIAVWKTSRLLFTAGAVLGVTAYLIALFAYSIAPVSYSGAIREVSVVIGAFFGWQFLGEKMGGMRVFGAIVIFAGILVIAIFG